MKTFHSRPFGMLSPFWGGDGLSLSQQVGKILEGSAGFVLDPLDLTRMWQDSGGTTPVTVAGDPVGRISSNFGSGVRNFLQSTAGFRPTFDIYGNLVLDGTDDRLVFANTSAFRGVSAATVICSIKPSSLAAQCSPYHFSNGLVASDQRMSAEIETTGAVTLTMRRLDADAAQVMVSAAGVVNTSETAIISHDVSFSSTGNARCWVNGVLVASMTIGGSLGVSENVNSLVANIGSRDTLDVFPGQIGRVFVAPFLLTDAQRAIVEAWVGEYAMVDPLTLFTAGGGSGTGVLFDTKQSPMFSDAGVTPAVPAGSVYRITDRVAGQFSDQPTAGFQGILQAGGGILTDGVDDLIPSPLTPFAISAGAYTIVTVTALDAVQSGSVDAYLFAQRTNNGNRQMIMSTLSTGRAQVVVGNSGNNINENLSSPILNGTTRVVVMTRDASGVIQLFVDGVSWGTATSDAPSAAAPAWHGHSAIGGFLKGVFKGGLIISRVMTPAEMLRCKRYWQ
jgi:hypothetical protein